MEGHEGVGLAKAKLLKEACARGRFGDRGELEWRMGEIRLSWGRQEHHGEVQVSMEKSKTAWRSSKQHGEVENGMEKFKTAWGT